MNGRRSYGRSGRLTPTGRLDRVAREIDARFIAQMAELPADWTPPTTADLLALALHAGLDAYLVEQTGRLMAKHPRGPYPTEIRNAAEIERLAALLPVKA